MRKLREKADVIAVDVGGAAAGTSDYERLRFETTLRGEHTMQAAAHNIGASEAALGAEYLRKVAASCGVPLISTNLRDNSGKPVASPLHVVSVGGRRVAILGILSETSVPKALRALSPRRAVLDVLASSQEDYDVTILLAYAPESELHELARSLPEVDAVVGGPTGQPIPPTPVGPTLLISATNQGKFLACLEATAGAETTSPWQGRIVELTDEFADDPPQVDNLKDFYNRLKQHDFASDQFGLVDPIGAAPDDYRVAGTETCRECHVADTKLWQHSQHAHAWSSLEEKGGHVDPQCQQCHTTGYGHKGGFRSVVQSPDRIDVGCESCHGPSLSHVRDPAVHTPRAGSVHHTCITCHDHENSPHFDPTSYWKQIRHGETTVTREGNP